MKKILAVSALTLVFAAACTFGVLFAAQSAVANTGSGYSFAIDAAVLKKGSTGSEVKKVQQKLKNWGYYSGSVDGIYGSCLLYTSPIPRDGATSRMPSSA